MRIAGAYCLVFSIVLSWCRFGAAGADAASLINSFEQGTSEPAGWSSLTANDDDVRGVWLDGKSHTGTRCLEGESKRARKVWASEWTPLAFGKRHLVDGWLQTVSGAAWLEVELRNSKGTILETERSPRVASHQDWTYVAVETPAFPGKHDGRLPKSGGDEITARIVFWVKGGSAALDDVAIHPAEPVEAANASFEEPVDSKERIPYWSEETENGLLPGARGGSPARSTDSPFQGDACLALSTQAEWAAASSVPYALWPGWDAVEVTAMARCKPGTRVRLLVMWSDAAQQFISAGVGEAVEGDGWRRVTSGEQEPPEGAYGFRPVLLAQRDSTHAEDSQTAWFDEVAMRVREKPFLRVVVNQVGYEQQGPKTAVVLTNFFPNKGPSGTAELLNAAGDRVWKSEITCAGRMYGQDNADWGWYFWRADFSSIEPGGQYTVRAEVGSEVGVSYPFRIGRDLLFQETAKANVDFFYVQRCGCEVPGWHAPCHLDDAKLSDGTHRDFTGGWHSAGDYNKLTYEYGDGGALFALVNAAIAAPQYFAQWDRDKDTRPDILDEAWWGARYVAKIQDPVTGGLLNHIEQGPDRKTWMNWCPPEKTTDNIAGTADDPIVKEGEGNSPLAIGGWIRLGGLLDAIKVENDYRARAVRLWEHAAAKAPSDPLLLISGLDLFLATREERYRAYCQNSVQGLLASGDANGQLAGGCEGTGDIPAAALACFALKLPDDPLAEAIKARLEKHLPEFIAEAANPLGVLKQKPGADGYFFEPTSAFGRNYQICCGAWSALMVYRVTRDPRALQFGVDQLDFVLGKNPYALCMMEGQGTYNLPRYHHRYITIPGHERGAVPGAIPNGFVRDITGRDRPGVDLSTGGRPYPSYRTNEPWLVHNVFYLLAVTALHESQQSMHVPN